MHWTEPASAEDSHADLERRLWDAANKLWANAALKPSDWSGATETTRQGSPKGERGGAHQFSPIVLGLIFLRYAETRFVAVENELGRDRPPGGPTSRRKIGPADYHAKGVLYLPEEARFGHLLQLPEGGNIGQAVNDAMRAVERENGAERHGRAVRPARRAREGSRVNPDLADVLPKTYQILENRTLAELLKVMASIPMDKGGEPEPGGRDIFGLISEPSGARKTARQGSPQGKRGGAYQYFLGKFAMSEGQKGGEWSGATWTTIGSPKGWRGGANQFYTPTSIVRLIVEILEPYHGRIYDPACGSGGMFIQSARFVEAHRANGTLTPGPSPKGRGGKYTGDPTKEISCHGQERVIETSRLARLNLAVHGLSGDIRQGNTYYEDLHDSVGRFDFVLANPPFNVSKIDKERLADDPRYAFGLPRTDNGNYLWIQHFHAALNPTGRAGFVMANSAADARASEQEIREKLIRAGHVDVMISIGSNFFYTVTLPCTLWFFDKSKSALPPSPPAPLPGGEGRKHAAEYDYENHVGARYNDTVLFIDARHIFRQLDRAHRDFTPAQIEFLANVVRLYRGEAPEFRDGSEEKIREFFTLPSTSGRGAGGEGASDIAYRDVPGLCKAATRAEIEAQGWSLNPGRYVGVAKGEELSDEDFKERLEALNEELEVLNAEARELEERIAANVAEILETA